MDAFDPARTAIFLLPLLQRPDSHASVTLPALAAGLSVLPPAIAAAFEKLGEEVKLHRQRAVSGEEPASAQVEGDNVNEATGRERRLEQEKIQHLQQSLASLSSLHASLQKRHLATVDALSDLQASVEPSFESLRDERDAQRAVNDVLRSTVTKLQAELVESKKAMDAVVEDVQRLDDFGVVEHARLDVFEPISPHFRAEARIAEDGCVSLMDDASEADTFRCSLHRQLVAGPSSEASTSGLCECGGSDAATTIHLFEQPSRSRKGRAVQLVADLTEQLEIVRHEARKSMREADRRAMALEDAIEARNDELRTLIGTMEDVLGLRGFVVQWPNKPPAKSQPPLMPVPSTGEESRSQRRSAMRTSPPRQPSQLELEVEELEQHLRTLEAREDYDTPAADDLGVDATSLASASTNNRSILSRALVDLSHQITDLKGALREVTAERDNLRNLRGFANRPPSTAPTTSQAAVDEALAAVTLERDRFADLLKSAEAQIYALQRQLGEQEDEFEQIADRVRSKLEEQKDKLDRAHKEIGALSEALEAAEKKVTNLWRRLDAEQRRSVASMNDAD